MRTFPVPPGCGGTLDTGDGTAEPIEPPTCILTGAAGEDEADCTTHEHERPCDENCAVHAIGCDGCCDHAIDHTNGCYAEEHADDTETREAELARCIAIARGCHDYNGGHHDEVGAGAFHHGIDTVVNALSASPRSAQVRVLERVGMTTGPWADGSSATFTPYIDPTTGTVGFKCDVNGEISYVFLCPSDGGSSPDVFVYHNESGDPADDGSVICVGFKEP